MRHRTWFPFILIGLSLTLLLVILASQTKEIEGSETPVVSQVNGEEYKQEMQSIVSKFQEDQDAKVAYDSAMQLKVPTEYKDLHLEITLYLVRAQVGKSTQEEWNTIRALYPWLTE